MIESDKYGTYHATNSVDYISWYDFTKEIFKQADIDTRVTPVSSDEFKAKAKRPFNSRMEQGELDRNGVKRLSDWKDALNRYLKEIGTAK